jgi:periodic tryptophan protein 1
LYFTESFVQGKVFSTQWSPDDPLTLAAAGSKAKLQLWDLGSNMGTRKVFASKLKASGKILKEKEAKEGHGGVIGVQSDGEESDADEE